MRESYFNLAMTPIWQGGDVFEEPFLFTPDPVSGEILPVRFLFSPMEVLEVRSIYENKVYKPGVDYDVSDGCLIRLPGSSMPFYTLDDFYPPEPHVLAIASESSEGRFVRYEGGGTENYRRLVWVSYRHSEDQSLYPFLPENSLSYLPKTAEKLKNNYPLSFVFYGDSIMAGCDATGRTGMAPYQPTLDRLVISRLSQYYKNNKISFVNTAVGGTTADWGLKNLNESVLNYNPDCVVFRFGMNDGSGRRPVEQYISDFREMITACAKKNPETEYIIWSSEKPNPDCKGWTGFQEQYEPALDELVAELRKTLGVSLIRVGVLSLVEEAVRRKGYPSLSANMVNHPNDFLIRLYAQVYCRALGVDACQ